MIRADKNKKEADESADDDKISREREADEEEKLIVGASAGMQQQRSTFEEVWQGIEAGVKENEGDSIDGEDGHNKHVARSNKTEKEDAGSMDAPHSATPQDDVSVNEEEVRLAAEKLVADAEEAHAVRRSRH